MQWGIPPSGSLPPRRSCARQGRAARSSSEQQQRLTTQRTAEPPSTLQGPHRRWLYPPRRWVIAFFSVLAAIVVLAVELALRNESGTRRGLPSRALAPGTTAHASGLIQAATASLPWRRERPHAQAQTIAEYSRAADGAAPSPPTTSPHLNIVAGSRPPQTTSSPLAHPERSISRNTPITAPSVDTSNSTSSGSSQPPPATPAARPVRARARAPTPHPKQPSNHWSQEPAPAAASSPHPPNAHRKVGKHVNNPDKTPKASGRNGHRAPAPRGRLLPLEPSGLRRALLRPQRRRSYALAAILPSSSASPVLTRAAALCTSLSIRAADAIRTESGSVHAPPPDRAGRQSHQTGDRRGFGPRHHARHTSLLPPRPVGMRIGSAGGWRQRQRAPGDRQPLAFRWRTRPASTGIEAFTIYTGISVNGLPAQGRGRTLADSCGVLGRGNA